MSLFEMKKRRGGLHKLHRTNTWSSSNPCFSISWFVYSLFACSFCCRIASRRSLRASYFFFRSFPKLKFSLRMDSFSFRKHLSKKCFALLHFPQNFEIGWSSWQSIKAAMAYHIILFCHHNIWENEMILINYLLTIGMRTIERWMHMELCLIYATRHTSNLTNNANGTHTKFKCIRFVSFGFVHIALIG